MESSAGDLKGLVQGLGFLGFRVWGVGFGVCRGIHRFIEGLGFRA